MPKHACWECGKPGKLIVKPPEEFRQNRDPLQNALVECPSGHTRELTDDEMRWYN